MVIANRCFEADTLDDLLRAVLSALLNEDSYVTATKGSFTEIVGAYLVIHNPRARLSRSESKGKIFSALGEFLWYMSGTNAFDFIDYYLPHKYDAETDDRIVVKSGYGERLFKSWGLDQVQTIIEILGKKTTSRQAVIQIYSATDMKEKSVPCTCTLQFLLREERLNLLVNMRSNDAYLGLPHDVFAFTMLQELVARALGSDLGIYQHFAGSLHLYEQHRSVAQAYLAEGWQNRIVMDKMPEGDQWDALTSTLEVEKQIREHGAIDLSGVALPTYWYDICVLLAIYNRVRNKDYGACLELKSKLSSNYYHAFIDDKLTIP
jgi:thymidylate synthase